MLSTRVLRCTSAKQSIVPAGVVPRPSPTIRTTLASPVFEVSQNVSTRDVAVNSQAGSGTTGGPGKPAKKKVKKLVDIEGDVMKDLSNGMFQVKLQNGVNVLAHLSGKIRQNRIKIVVGDHVTVELSPYDLTRGRITLRHKQGAAAAAEEEPQQ